MPRKKIVLEPQKNVWVIIEPDNPVTVCTIKQTGNRLVAFGIGVCKHGDKYDLETGCRMALKSALKDVPYSNFRQKTWEKYLEMFPVKDRVKPAKIGWKEEVDWLAKLVSNVINA